MIMNLFIKSGYQQSNMKAVYQQKSDWNNFTNTPVNFKPQRVEIVGLDWENVRHIDKPLLHSIKIRFENGTHEWVNPNTITLSRTQSER